MQDQARRKKFQLIQESLLKEEQEKYDKSKEEFAKWDNADLKEAPYIWQRYIEKIHFSWWEPIDLNYYIEELETAKKNASVEYIKIFTKLDMLGYDTEHDWYVEIPHWHSIVGYKLLPENEIKVRAKSAFISAVSKEAHERYLEMNPEDKGRWKMQVSCFLIEAFLNWEIEFDFLVRATYKGCSI